jgi:aromatic ring hydroxylase
MRTPEEYIESIKDDREVYYRSKRVEDVTAHPILNYTARFISQFQYGKDMPKELKDGLFYVNPDLGIKINMFYKVPQSSEDLLARSKLQSKSSLYYRTSTAHIGSDYVFALIITSNYVGDEYAQRMRKFVEYILKEDPMLAGAQMDVKGDRSLRPSEQKDLDMYVHVVEERPDGVIVRGAKNHISWVFAANEILVIPSRTMQRGEEEFAIGFAIPPNTKNLRMICRPCLELEATQNEMENTKLRKSAHFGEALVIFDNVFVPWDRVFVYKDPAAATRLALTAALFHRFTAVSYRSALASFLVGIGKLAAEFNGVEKVAHIRQDIVTLIEYTEMQKVCARLAAYECSIDPKTGIAIPNPLYTNLGKLYSNRNHLKAREALIDIAGGLAITAPSSDDFLDPKLRKDIDKYLAGSGVCGSDRFRLFLLIREIVAIWGGLDEVGELHAEGSIWPSIMELYRTYNYDEITRAVKDDVGIM